MGCTSSKPVPATSDNLLRSCKIRRLHIKNAIKYRQDFAAAHMAYIHSLKHFGFALKCFAGCEFLDTDVSSRPSSTPVLALPPPSSSSLGNLSPPQDSRFYTTALSPPRRIYVSPPLSPIRLPEAGDQSVALHSTSNQSTAFVYGPSVSPHCTSPLFNTPASSLRIRSLDRSIVPSRTKSLSDIVSPDRESDFSSSYFSPSRDDLDEALVEYCPPHPSSLITETTWFHLDEFTPPVIPQHLQEQRRIKRATDLEHKDSHEPHKLEDAEAGIPDLEEAAHVEDEYTQDDRNIASSNKMDATPTLASNRDAPLDTLLPEDVSKRAVLDETMDVSASKIDQNEDVGDSMEDSMPKTTSLPQESVDLQTRRNVAPVVVLKEKTLSEAMQFINDLCVQAYQCGHDVSRMLETQMQFQPKASGLKDVDEDDDLLECGMTGSHASTLERLYAWERKLHYEVKEGRMLRISFDRKFKELHILNAKGVDQFQRDKLKSIIKKLDMRLLVSLEAISAASCRIQKLTNDELYPQLCELLEGLTVMWRSLAECHRTQTAVALEFQTIEDMIVKIEARESHKRATAKLKQTLLKLQNDFKSWIWSQSKYIHELDEWIRRCYKVPDLSEKPVKAGKGVFSDRKEKTPIFHLLKAWRSSIMNFTPDSNVSAIKRFTAAMHVLEEDQFMEQKFKTQSERSTRQLDREMMFLDNLEKNSMKNKKLSSSVFSPSRLLRMPLARSVEQKRARFDRYKAWAEKEKQDYLTAVESRENMTASLLQQQLPLLFESLSSLAEEAKIMYENVKEIAEASGTSDRQLLLHA